MTPLYHATSASFGRFRTDRFAVFFLRRGDADALAARIAAEEGKSRVIVRYANLSRSIIGEAEALAIWNQCNGGDETAFIYSMMCHVTREYPPEQVTHFLVTLRQRGILGVRYQDYDPANSDRDVPAVALVTVY